MVCTLRLPLSILLCTAQFALSISGVCYDSFQAIGNVDAHFSFLKRVFGAVRTYQTSVANQVNLIDSAAKAGLKIAAGIWLRGPIAFADDLQATIDGTKRNPNSVLSIYVGNEDLDNGWNVTQVIDKIKAVKTAFAAAGLANIPIGTVQTDAQMIAHPELGAVCDVVGVNIYPFFEPAPMDSPIDSLDRRYSAMKAAHGSKIRLTETGWPTADASFLKYIADTPSARQYFKGYQAWAARAITTESFYFQFADVPPKGGYEAHFGLSADSISWKFDVEPTVAPTPSPTPSPTTSVPSSTTPLASTIIPTSSAPTTKTTTATLKPWSLNTSVVPTTTKPDDTSLHPTSNATPELQTDRPTTSTLSHSSDKIVENTMSHDTLPTSSQTGVIVGGIISVVVVAVVAFVAKRELKRRATQQQEAASTGKSLVPFRSGGEILIL
ncbi:unnamed protein product [Aphanomyces euteiches]